MGCGTSGPIDPNKRRVDPNGSGGRSGEPNAAPNSAGKKAGNGGGGGGGGGGGAADSSAPVNGGGGSGGRGSLRGGGNNSKPADGGGGVGSASGGGPNDSKPSARQNSQPHVSLTDAVLAKRPTDRGRLIDEFATAYWSQQRHAATAQVAQQRNAS